MTPREKLRESLRKNAEVVAAWPASVRNAICTALIFSTGCASTIPAGLETTHRGMAVVDMGFDGLTAAYVQAHALCARNEALPGCDRLGDKAEVMRKANALGAAYDSTAAGLDAMQAAYDEIAPHFECAAEIVKGAGLFAR